MANSTWGTDVKIWPKMDPPFSPARADIEILRRYGNIQSLDDSGGARVLLLGLTPTLVDAGWPMGTVLHAVDYDQAMVDALWKVKRGAYCHLARWQEMPFQDDLFDLVIGDCSLNALPSLEAYDEVFREITRVRRPESKLISRFFVRPEPCFSLADIAAGAVVDLSKCNAAGKRLLILLAATQEDGRLFFRDIERKIIDQWGDVNSFLLELQMTEEDVNRARQTYRFDQVLNFPTQKQIEERCLEFFVKLEFIVPEYILGKFCMTLFAR